MARDPANRPYRIAVYAVYGLFCAIFFIQLVRSVAGDLYGRPRAGAEAQEPAACLDDLERLYAQISARAVQPAPRGLDSDALKREWDQWSRRWDADVSRVRQRCRFDAAPPAMAHLGDALEGIEELRRMLTRSGESASEEARRVKESLASARALLHGQ